MTEILDRQVIQEARDRYEKHNARQAKRMRDAVESGDASALNRLDELPRYVNRFVQMGRPELAAETLEGMATGRFEKSALERIIEQSELMSVGFFARGMAAARAVGRVVVRNAAGQTRGHGTGFMISPRLMMTNNHVLASSASASLSLIEFDYALAIDGQPMVPRRFQLDPDLFFTTSVPLDFTIVGVEPQNAEGEVLDRRGWIHLIAESGKAVAGEPINIIQHPGGERQQVAIRENRIVGPDGDFLIYTTDTKRGSSGSPALNDQWQLAALHHAGVPKEDAAGNWLRKDGGIYRTGIDDPGTINWIANEGVRISRIVTNVKERDLTSDRRALFEDAFQPAPLILENMPSTQASDRMQDMGAGPVIGPDGIARWNFQLAFGPLFPVEHPAPTPLSKTPIRAPAQPVETPDRSAKESVFEPRGPYFDQAAEDVAIQSYYDAVANNLTKATRYQALHDLVKETHHTSLTYASARHNHLYPWIDRATDETLKSIYSGDTMAEELFVAELLAFEAAIERAAAVRETTVAGLSAEVIEAEDAALEQTGAFNCEHVVPQSWFKGDPEQRSQKSDMHHLFTCESGCNSFRSNIPYSEFSTDEEIIILASEVSTLEALLDPTLEAVRPKCGLRDGRRFEPSAGKGAVARATLYFVLRYPGVVGDVKRGSKKEFLKSQVGTLLEWAENEPPDIYERHRNAEIAKVQGNRNPLIDRPEWLRKIAFEDGFG